MCMICTPGRNLCTRAGYRARNVIVAQSEAVPHVGAEQFDECFGELQVQWIPRTRPGLRTTVDFGTPEECNL